MAAGWFVVTGPESFAVVLVIHGVVSGCHFTLSASLGQRLFPKSLFAQIAMLLAISNVVLAPMLGKTLYMLGHNYRYVFLFGTLTTLLSVLTLFRVYRSYLKLGGDRCYTPPNPGE